MDFSMLRKVDIEQEPAAPGTAVEARVAGSARAGVLVGHPVYDPERRRAKER